MNIRTSVLALLVFASLQAHADRQGGVDGGVGYVRLESSEAGAPANSHPASVLPAQLVTFLSQLQVTAQGSPPDDDPRALLTERSIDHLATAISGALSNARPDQDIAFAVTDIVRPGALGPESLATSGRIFVRDGELNLILGEIAKPLRSLVTQGTEPAPQPRAGYRSKAVMDQIEVEIESGTRRRAISSNALVGSRAFHFPEGSRKDWVAASLAAIAAERIEAPALGAQLEEPSKL